MNIIRVRDVAKDMYKAKFFAQKTMIALATAPVFVYETRNAGFTPEEVAWNGTSLGRIT